MARIRLLSLKLTGFKSFPDEVELTFPGKVSAIIGPNGCGKSNLVDAILWVLGEQSPTLMRLKQMGDVVFTGAASRQPAGAAEVALVLRADDGHWQETDGRLELRRRVYKAGPSEYRLNGRTARLKDVFDQLAQVGLGTRAYSIIEQGRVGQVLSARPIDRRALLEEAAGITRYKARKHEAVLKLEHTRQNLLRLDDVIGEVTRTLRQLKRQAKQAERHQQLEAKLKDALRRLFTIEARTLDSERSEITRRRGTAQNEVAAAAAALGSSEADLGRARELLDASRVETETAREEVATLLGSRERLEAFLERSADLLDNLRSSLDRTRSEIASLTSNRATVTDRTTVAAAKVDELQQELGGVQGRVAEADQAHTDAVRRCSDAENAAGQLRQDLLRTISTLTASRNRLGDIERERDRLSFSLGQLKQDRDRLDSRRHELGAGVDEAVEASRKTTASAQEIARRRRELAEERERLREQAIAAKQEAESLGHATWETRHQLHGVERELARHTAASDHLGTVIPETALLGRLGDFVHPSPDLAPLLDRAWRDWLELPVVDGTQLTEDQLEELSTFEGRIRVVMAGDPPPTPTVAPIPGAEDMLPKAGVDEDALGWMIRVLPRTLRCDDAARARELADEHPEAIIIDPDHLFRSGRIIEPATAGTRHAGTLELRTIREDLSSRLEDMAKRSEQSAKNHGAMVIRLEDLSGELAAVDAEVLAAEQERARAAAVEASLVEELGRIDRELESIAAETKRGAARAEELAQQHARLEHEVDELEARSAALEKAVDDAAADVTARRDDAGEALRELDRWRAEARLGEQRVEAAATERDRLVEEAAALDQRIEALAQDGERLSGELAATEDEVVRSRTRLVEEQGLLAAARDQERRAAEKTDASARKVEQLEKEVRQRRDRHEREREVLHEIDVEKTRIDGSWDRIREHAADELGVGLEVLLEDPSEFEEEPDSLRERIDGIRGRLERMGPVNLLALKEVEELEERSSFLKSQRKDLVDALRSLDTTIAEIDATCTERFVTTFEQVNAVFAETFSTLFGGGTARLDLVDEDDPLESGIDISAQPPGKKNQSVQLLSGGEKALAALSLLLALFRIKPSPFCILDEVDAPLDDANVERLADLVHAMTDHTQFVLITHNRRTMQRADLLYGVTMEEPGVSKVVSVRLED